MDGFTKKELKLLAYGLSCLKEEGIDKVFDALESKILHAIANDYCKHTEREQVSYLGIVCKKCDRILECEDGKWHTL